MSKITNKNKKQSMENLVMKEIEKKHIKMKPRWIFVAGSVLSFIGLAGSMFTSIFLINLIIFLVRKQGPGIGKLNMVLSSFPVWIPIVAVLAIILGAFLLSKYDFSYKRNFKLIIIAFIVSLLVAGFVMDRTGLNDVLSKKGAMRGLYQGEERSGSIYPGYDQGGGRHGGMKNGYNKYR